MKKIFIRTIAAASAILMLFALIGCVKTDKKYFKKVSDYSFWDNLGSESIAQYKFYNIMDEYLSSGKIENGQCIDKDGKKLKVLFLGWDGVRADALTNIFYDENSFDTNGYNYQVNEYSGLHKLKEQGGLYMAYVGGEKKKDSQQSSSTCAGWTSELTGGWHNMHGVKENDDVKNAASDTLMLKYAKKGLNTGFAFDWGQYFDITLREEVKYLLENPSTPLKYCDIDRPKAFSNQDIMKNEEIKKEKEINAVNLDYYNAVSNGNISPNAKYDIAMRDYLKERINLDDDIVAGVFHRPDTNGHTNDFSNGNADYVNSVRNANIYLYQLLEIIEKREQEQNEKWLIIVTSDHGGSDKGHGKQTYEHRTIWIASNYKIEKKYFGKNYNGFKEA